MPLVFVVGSAVPDRVLSKACLVAVFIVLGFLARWTSKAVISRSRTGLLFAGLVLMGFAGLFSLQLFSEERPISERVDTGSMVATVLVGSVTCLIQAFSRKRTAPTQSDED